MSELDSSDVEEQYNETWTEPTLWIAIQQVSRDGLVNVKVKWTRMSPIG